MKAHYESLKYSFPSGVCGVFRKGLIYTRNKRLVSCHHCLKWLRKNGT